ncbi:MAG: NADH-quinone oxidoreductase subunit NuoK [Planctomycetes bacterium]|nr:NADH-quinone oxidoreductase subunit NuoK [Planctomycetota bacterium]
MVPQAWYLLLSALLFGLGIAGFVARRNTLVMFMSVELMLNAANVVFLAAARDHVPARGSACALFVIAVAAAEVAVGLALVLALFRLRKSVQADEVRELRA